jgi:hypothetical protein
MPTGGLATATRKATAKQRAEVMKRARVQVADDWQAMEARQAIDDEASRQLVREHRAMDGVRKEREAQAAALAATTRGEDPDMAKDKATTTRKTSMSDDDVIGFIAKHLAKDPAAGVGAVYRALRAAGKSCSGGRVRTLFEQGRKAAGKGGATKPATKPAFGKSKPAPKPTKKGRGVAGDRPNSAAGKKRAAAARKPAAKPLMIDTANEKEPLSVG